MGHEEEGSWLWPVSPLVTTPCPVLALFLNKLFLAVVQMLNLTFDMLNSFLSRV